MNRGALSGFAPAIGAYNPMPTGGSYSGNRGRVSVDEIRLQGNHDNTAYTGLPVGAVRLFNTNPQSKTSNLAFPGDLGAFMNILNGWVMTQGGFPPADAFYNTAGIVMCGATPTDGAGAYVSNTTITNQPGVAAQFGSFNGLSSFNLFLANGTACTVPAYADIFSGPNFGTTNDGTLAPAEVTNFQGTCNVATTGVTIGSRIGLVIVDAGLTGTSAVTTQVGVSIPLLVSGTSNTGIQMGTTGNQTLTAHSAGAQINFLPGTTTLNYPGAYLDPLINASGTLVLQESAFAYGLMFMFNNAMTITNLSTVAADFGPVIMCNYAPTIQADTQSITGGTHYGFNAAPTFTTINSGSLENVSVDNFRSTGNVSTTGATVVAWTHYSITGVAVSSGGALTTQVGLSIPSMTGATYNNGIICATNSAFGSGAASGAQDWAIRIQGGNNASSGLEVDVSTTGPTVPPSDAGGVVSVYAGSGGTNFYLLVTFNDGGTTRYKYLKLNGAGSTWNEATSLPT